MWTSTGVSVACVADAAEERHLLALQIIGSITYTLATSPTSMFLHYAEYATQLAHVDHVERMRIFSRSSRNNTDNGPIANLCPLCRHWSLRCLIWIYIYIYTTNFSVFSLPACQTSAAPYRGDQQTRFPSLIFIKRIEFLIPSAPYMHYIDRYTCLMR